MSSESIKVPLDSFDDDVLIAALGNSKNRSFRKSNNTTGTPVTMTWSSRPNAP